MCGIFGSSNITPEVWKMLPFLALSMQARGEHAWGASNGTDTVRHLGLISKGWGGEIERFSHWRWGIFHTRQASQGASGVLENAHPFTFTKADGTPIIGIHNGCLSNHTELNTKHIRTCIVDSEHLWMHKAEGRDWKDIKGYANVAWFETRDGIQQMRIARVNSSFLHCARTEDGGIVWCSTLSALQLAADMTGTKLSTTYTLKEDLEYRLDSEDIWETEDKLEFGKDWTVSTGGNFPPRYTSRADYLSSVGTLCWKCNRTLAVKEDLLCETCVTSFLTVFKLMDGVGKRLATARIIPPAAMEETDKFEDEIEDYLVAKGDV